MKPSIQKTVPRPPGVESYDKWLTELAKQNVIVSGKAMVKKHVS